MRTARCSAGLCVRGRNRQGLVYHVLLVAESAAQIGLDDPHIPHRHPDGIRQIPPQGMGGLGAGDHQRALLNEIREEAESLGVLLDAPRLDRKKLKQTAENIWRMCYREL